MNRHLSLFDCFLSLGTVRSPMFMLTSALEIILFTVDILSANILPYVLSCNCDLMRDRELAAASICSLIICQHLLTVVCR